MRLNVSGIFLAIIIQTGISLTLSGQSWDFIKEKDGIRIYTRAVKNSSLKSFKGETDLSTDMDKLSHLIGNAENTSWWDKNVKDLKILAFEHEKYIRYYLAYDIPWPLTDRDLCVEAKITNDPLTGMRTVMSTPLPNVIPENPDRVRIKKYWQKWTLTPIEKGRVHIELEGFVDPGGNIPDWLYNMVITETPLKIIRGIQKRVQDNYPE
jgi:hypothetical protein